MYESFFRFTSRPFVAAPLASSYFAAESTEAARQTLTRSIDRAEGPGLIVGPTGTGKTLLCRVIADRFQETFQVAMLSSTRILTRKALLQNILFELGRDYRGLEEGELRLSLLDYLQPNDDCPNGILLIIDEAHSLPLRLLEEIRMITNLVRDGQPRVRLVMAGSSKLEEKFASPKLESFNQRVAARCYLESFGREETYDYVLSRVSAAGGNADTIFNDDALRAVYQATDGIPRLINQVCDHALVMAFAGGRQQIDGAGIEEAWADLQQLPGPWNESTDTEISSNAIEFGELDDEPSAFESESDAADEFDRVEDLGTNVHFGDVVIEVSDHHTPVLELRIQESLVEEPIVVVDEPAPIVENELVVVNPFGDDFDEEEVVIDQQIVQSSEIFSNRTRVASREGREIVASMLPLDEAPTELVEEETETISQEISEPVAAKETIAEVVGERFENVPVAAEEQSDLVDPVPVPSEPTEDAATFEYVQVQTGAEMFEYTAYEPNATADLALETLCDVNVAIEDLQAELRAASRPTPEQPAIEELGIMLLEHPAVSVADLAGEAAVSGADQVVTDDSHDDRSIIVVENDVQTNTPGTAEGSVHRVEYQTLFAQLRQG